MPRLNEVSSLQNDRPQLLGSQLGGIVTMALGNAQRPEHRTNEEIDEPYEKGVAIFSGAVSA